MGDCISTPLNETHVYLLFWWCLCFKVNVYFLLVAEHSVFAVHLLAEDAAGGIVSHSWFWTSWNWIHWIFIIVISLVRQFFMFIDAVANVYHSLVVRRYQLIRINGNLISIRNRVCFFDTLNTLIIVNRTIIHLLILFSASLIWRCKNILTDIVIDSFHSTTRFLRLRFSFHSFNGLLPCS